MHSSDDSIVLWAMTLQVRFCITLTTYASDLASDVDTHLFSRVHHPQYGSLAPRHCAHVEYWLQSYTFSLVNWNQQRKYITTLFIYICMPVIIINIIYTHLSGILQRKYITTLFIYICMPVIIINIIYTHLSGILQRKYITTLFIYICVPVIISIIYTHESGIL